MVQEHGGRSDPVHCADKPVTDTRTTLAGNYVVSDVDGKPAVTLAGAYALSGVATNAKAMLAGAYVAFGQPVQVRIPFAGVYAVATHTACLTTRCQCWKITRVDGAVYRFTTHDDVVMLHGEEYTPCEGLAASAIDSSMTSTGNDAGDVEVLGLLSDDVISAADVADGLFDGAKFEAWRVDWGETTEIPQRLVKGILSSSTVESASYKAQVLTPAARLAQQPLLDVHTAACRWELGDSRCTVNLPALTVAGAVTATATLNAVTQLHRRRFQDSSRVEANGYFTLGTLTWTSGDNVGRSSEVKSFVGGVTTLWSLMPHPIQLGDTYDLVPGCNKLKDTCKTKYSNYINFGGFPDVPGQDAITETPDAKAG